MIEELKLKDTDREARKYAIAKARSRPQYHNAVPFSQRQLLSLGRGQSGLKDR